MRRYEALQEIASVVQDEFVVVNIGHPSQEFFVIRDRPQNFYMLGSMGLASSIALGVAMSHTGCVIAIEGDAAVSMNLGTLATIGHVRPANLIVVVIDNGANGSTGFQPSFTAGSLDLAGMARSAGITDVHTILEQQDVAPALSKAIRRRQGPSVIVIKTAPSMPDGIKPIPLGPAEVRSRFEAALRAVAA